MTDTRIEKDSLGEVRVPTDALYGAQTQRAITNFEISERKLPRKFIQALVHLKRAAAAANSELNLLEENISDAIIDACNRILSGEFLDQFPIDVFQTGSGTSTNMNANEVIARIASLASGEKVHPNDHVNMSQSSNDTIPSAIHVSAALALKDDLFPAISHLHRTLLDRSKDLNDKVKTGRTHLMDAMPITLGQELGGWAYQLVECHARLQACMPQVLLLAQGGTAVGTGINAHSDFSRWVGQFLHEVTGIAFRPSDNYFALMSSQDTAVSISGQLKTLAVTLMKISNDLRWMNSGPLAGLGEIALPALQPGSSIMPGKVNPVIPEAVAMACAQVIGNDTTITIAGQSGNFQLNVMLPLVAYNLLDSISLLANACEALLPQIAHFTVNDDALNHALAKNPILVTALNRHIGYEKAAAIAKKAYKENRPILDIAQEETDLTPEHLRELLNPSTLTRGGILD